MNKQSAIDLAIKDLNNYTAQEIKTLAKYYNIPYYTKKQVILILGPEIVKKHFYKATFPGDCDPPDEFKVCMNDKDYISLDCWSNDFKPQIQIRFLNSSDYTKTPQTLCMMISDFREIIADPNSEFRAWYPNREGRIVDPEGYGGKASQVEKYLKLFNYFVSNTQKELFTDITPGIYNAYPIYMNKLLGNKDSAFGIGQIHGQTPGYTVYYIVKKGTNEKNKILQEIKRLNDLKDIETDTDISDTDIKNLIDTQLADQTLLPVVDIDSQLPAIKERIPANQHPELSWFLNDQVDNALLYGKNRQTGNWVYIGEYGHPSDMDEDINDPDNTELYTEFLSSHTYSPESIDPEEYDYIAGVFTFQTRENKNKLVDIILGDFQGMRDIGNFYENRNDDSSSESYDYDEVYESDMESDEYGF